MVGNQSNISIISNFFATILIGITLVGWLGTPSAANGDTEPSESELSGYVYVDLNIDGFRQTSEASVPAIEVVLTKLSDPDFSITMFSDYFGYYEFIGLNAGIYSITQPQLPMGVRNVYVREGKLTDPLADAGTAELLDQSQGILPHVEGIELPDRATTGTSYNFGQIYLGKAWLTTEPHPIIPEGGQIPEPSTGLLLAFGGFLLGTIGRHSGKRST